MSSSAGFKRSRNGARVQPSIQAEESPSSSSHTSAISDTENLYAEINAILKDAHFARCRRATPQVVPAPRAGEKRSRIQSPEYPDITSAMKQTRLS